MAEPRGHTSDLPSNTPSHLVTRPAPLVRPWTLLRRRRRPKARRCFRPPLLRPCPPLPPRPRPFCSRHRSLQRSLHTASQPSRHQPSSSSSSRDPRRRLPPRPLWLDRARPAVPRRHAASPLTQTPSRAQLNLPRRRARRPYTRHLSPSAILARLPPRPPQRYPARPHPCPTERPRLQRPRRLDGSVVAVPATLLGAVEAVEAVALPFWPRSTTGSGGAIAMAPDLSG